MIQAQAFFDEMLRQYPKLNSPAVINALYTFTNELVRKSNTALNTVPSEDTETRALTFTDKNNTEIAHISFTQYANANIGINFVLGEHTFTIKVSDEGHIDLRSSYPLCGFSQVSDEVATTEYVIRCAEHYDAILENALKEYIADALNDFEDELKLYSDEKDAALKVDLKAYVDVSMAALRREFTSWKNEMLGIINNAIEELNASIATSITPRIGKYKIVKSSKDGIDNYTYTASTSGFLMFFAYGKYTASLKIGDKEITDGFVGSDGYGTRRRPVLLPVSSGSEYKLTNICGPVIFFPLEVKINRGS